MREEITGILKEWSSGDESAVDRLFPLVYDELRRLARAYMNRERRGHTFQPTELVNEAFMRLVDVESIEWNDRAHFYAISSTIMRRILVDYARSAAASKRGGGMKRLTLENIQVAEGERAAELLDLDEALTELGKVDDRKARVVEMNYFGGLSQAEIAKVLGVAPKTVQRDLEFSRLWLYRELEGRFS